MSNSLANTLLANLNQLKNKPTLEANPTSVLDPNSAAETALNRLIEIPLVMLTIDTHQPRQFLPFALREQVTRGQCSATDAMETLIAQAESGNLEMQGYIETLKTLAESITAVGLQQPLRVSQERQHDGRTMFRLVDGERRFWALLYRICADPETLVGSREQKLTSIKVPALLHDEHASADDIQRAQWAANLYHEAICAVDYAEVIWGIREDYFARLDTQQRESLLAQLGEAANGLTPNDIAIELTAREVARLTGKTLKRRVLYHYLSIADKLCAEARALARAYTVGLRQLTMLARMTEPKQVEMLTMSIQAERGDSCEANATKSASGTGRPSSVQRSINGCITLVSVLHQLSDKSLDRNSRQDKEELLAELEHVAAEIERTRRYLHAHLGQQATT